MKSYVRTENGTDAEKGKTDDWKITDPVASMIKTTIVHIDQWRRLDI
jgi:hypothetical protein